MTPCENTLFFQPTNMKIMKTHNIAILRVYNSHSFGDFEQEVDSKSGSCSIWDAWFML